MTQNQPAISPPVNVIDSANPSGQGDRTRADHFFQSGQGRDAPHDRIFKCPSGRNASHLNRLRAGLERLESLVILSTAPVLPEVPDVDDREPPPLQPRQVALPIGLDR